MKFSDENLYHYINSISPLHDGAFEAFASILSDTRLEKGAFFAIQGRTEQDFGIITQGVVRTFFRDNEGSEHIKSFGVPYSFVGGYSSLISNTPSQISVQAITDCSILRGRYAALTNLFEDYSEIETLSRRITESLFILKEKREIDFLSLTAEKRYRHFQTDYEGLEFQVPQYYIASYLGITATQLSRIRRKLSGS